MATSFEEEDDLIFPFSEEPASPVPKLKLKRLKKASYESEKPKVKQIKLSDPAATNQILPPDSSEPGPDLSVSEPGGLIEELRKERFEDPLVRVSNLNTESESLPPDSSEQELDPSFSEPGGLIEELRKERFDEPRVRVSISSESAIDPLFPESEGLIEELKRGRLEETRVRVSDPPIPETENVVPSDSAEQEASVGDDGLDPLFPDSGGLVEELRRERVGEPRVRAPNLAESELRTEDDDDDGLDPLFPDSVGYQAWEGEEMEQGSLIEELRREKSAKKRLNLDGDKETMEMEFDNEKKNKKLKSNKTGDSVKSKPKESAREKRKLEKERRAQLDQMHVESQRLLRETRDASFKPVPMVQKPISSVLEKIRLRKMEILKMSNTADSFTETECSTGPTDNSEDPNITKDDMNLNMCLQDDGRTGDSNPDHCENDAMDQDDHDDVHVPDNEKGDNDQDGHENSVRNEYLKKGNDRINDTADDIIEEEIVDSDDVSSSLSSSSEEEGDEDEEEDNNKENIDPRAHEMHPTDTPDPKSALIRDFVDDEAEEEDDSDHDLTRFQENEDSEEENENEIQNGNENEALNDIIATGFEERKRDREKRGELHRKWLEQQDAAETNKFLQRLKFGKQESASSVHEEEEEENEDEDFADESGDADGDSKKSVNVVRQNSERAKQMMAKMFSDDQDSYMSSDDEQIEESLLRQRLSNSIQVENSSLTSPIEDEHSREVFGLIKKLNIAPQTKRRVKQTPSFDMLTLGGNNNSSSKSSFLGRTSGSLPSSHKPATFKTFIFGRDDSNSKSSLASSENQPEPETRENNQSRKISAKFTGSQTKSTTFNTNSGASTSTGSSLFEILRRSSTEFDKQIELNGRHDTHSLSESQTTYQFSAFKIGRRFSRVEARN